MNKKRPPIPQVESLLQEPAVIHWFDRISRPMTVSIIRRILEETRSEWLHTGAERSQETIYALIDEACRNVYRKRPVRILNATGIIIHTNLGRSPLDSDTWDAASALNTGYTSLEFDLASGKRGQRNNLVSDLLSLATNAESAMVVNNNAAALYLALSTFAKRKEVIVSRGELVQIGGGFRIPDILRQSGAKLIEVGTTNITTCADYVSAITEKTAMVLKVHRSNFALRGFSEEPTTAQIAASLPRDILLMVDQGSGVLTKSSQGETAVQDHVAQGAHLVSFSADKALGSVQAGCVVGPAELIDKLLKAPLYRVLRPGKTVLTLLEQTMINYLNGKQSPIWRFASQSLDQLRTIGQKIIEGFPSSSYELVEAPMTLGGGSFPDEYLPGVAIKVSLSHPANQTLALLRSSDPPIIGIIEKDVVLIHLGTLFPSDIPLLRNRLLALQED